jgi:hypothetical protein
MRSDQLFEIGESAPLEPFESPELRRSTDFQARAARSGADFKEIALRWLEAAGAIIERREFRVGRFPVDALISGTNRRQFIVLARGTPQESKSSGLRRPDTVEKVGFMAMQLARTQQMPILLITSDLPAIDTQTGFYLSALSPDVWDVIATRGDFRGFQRLRSHLHDERLSAPPSTGWRRSDEGDQNALWEHPKDD